MFFTSRHAASGDRSPTGNFWFEPTGMRASSGMRVTSQTAMRLSAVYACTRVLAETFAVLPFKLRKVVNGQRTVVTDHWLYRRLTRSPNRWQTAFEWREMVMGHLVLRGNAFNQLIGNAKGEIEEFIPLHPDRVKIELLDNGSFRYLVTQRDGSTVTLQRGEVWHLRGLSGDGFVGYNPIEIAGDVLGLGIASQAYGSRFYANDAKPGGWIELPGSFADEPTRQTFKDSWKKSQGGGNRGSTAVLEKGMKYHELSLNNSDAQFLETRKFNRSEIAAIFRVPLHKIGDLEHATFSNIEQLSQDFANDTMTPWAERWESSIYTNLLFEDDGYEIDFDFHNLLRGDSKARASYYNSGIVSGWLTRNEAREAEGLEPIDGLEDPLQPLNMANVGDDPLPDPADQKDKLDDAPPVQPTDARASALARAAAERVARRELEVVRAAASSPDWPAAVAAAYVKHAQFVASALCVSIEAARAYCESRRTDGIDRDNFDATFLPAATHKLERLALKGSL